MALDDRVLLSLARSELHTAAAKLFEAAGAVEALGDDRYAESFRVAGLRAKEAWRDYAPQRIDVALTETSRSDADGETPTRSTGPEEG